MTAPGGPGRRGRHSAGDGTGGFPPAPWTPGTPSVPGTGYGLPPARFEPWADTGPLGGRAPGLLDRPDLPRARHSGGDDEDAGHRPDTQHPSAPLPPRPAGVWDRLQARGPGAPDDDATVAHHVDPNAIDPRDPGHGETHAGEAHPGDEQHGYEQHGYEQHGYDDDTDSWDRTGGLEVIGSHEQDEHDASGAAPVRRRRRSAGRRRRGPWSVLVSLLVLGGLVAGIVVGVQALMGLMAAEDYPGEGTGSVEVRIAEGDTLSDIARTLVDADVIASTRPFVDAAEERPEATGIQPGLYGLRQQMSGAAAVDLLLDPSSRLLSRVTVPEGLTVEATLARIADETGRPLEELQAAAADPAALGLPAYAAGSLEGYLFPATYDVDPGQSSADILRAMVEQFTEVAADLQLEQRAAALGRTPAEIVDVASMIQSETRLDEERPDVAQVIYNRLRQGIPLGIDATLAFGLDKNGNELTVTDLQTDSPYNTRTRGGLPPTPISSPGEASLEAALAPTTGDLLYYVLESEDGAHFFTDDYAEFQAARQRCAAAGLGCGG